MDLNEDPLSEAQLLEIVTRMHYELCDLTVTFNDDIARDKFHSLYEEMYSLMIWIGASSTKDSMPRSRVSVRISDE